MRDGLQTVSFFEIQYHNNAKISIKSIHGNGNYLSVQLDGSLLFNSEDVNQTELFQVCGYNTGRVCLRNYEGNVLAFGEDRVLKSIENSGIKPFQSSDFAGDYKDWHPWQMKGRDDICHFLIYRDIPNEFLTKDASSQSALNPVRDHISPKQVDLTLFNDDLESAVTSPRRNISRRSSVVESS